MFRIFIVDISGKVVNYDFSLLNAIADLSQGDVKLFTPDVPPNSNVKHLIALIPKRFKNTENLFKRLFKAIEGVLNYLIFFGYCLIKKPNVIHFQWLPFLEVCSFELLVLKGFRLCLPHTKLVLTIHNIYPHAFDGDKKDKYNSRFQKAASFYDEFIVHTEKTKKDIVQEFKLKNENISVVHHGIFKPKNYIPRENKVNDNELKFIMYGNLSDYKGVDVFVAAIKSMPESYKKKVKAVIAGEMQNKELCRKLQEDSKGLNIVWYPYFLPEMELYKRIDDSNVIVLPYKHISQSGVLLLALSFGRYVITSDLPTFKETLHGFSDDMFFETENPGCLAQLMMRYVDREIDTRKQMCVIDNLVQQYSWENAAKMTINVYNKQAKA